MTEYFTKFNLINDIYKMMIIIVQGVLSLLHP